MNARDRWLASFSSENTRHTYEQIFAAFWEAVSSRYSPPLGVDALDWIAEHRAAEIRNSRAAHRVPRHCESIVTEWYASLMKNGDLDSSSLPTYISAVNSFFKRLLPDGAGALR